MKMDEELVKIWMSREWDEDEWRRRMSEKMNEWVSNEEFKKGQFVQWALCGPYGPHVERLPLFHPVTLYVVSCIIIITPYYM